MKTFNHIITSGCSFSDPANLKSWPLHLGESFGVDCNHLGLGSQGNGLIARKAIHAVHTALKDGYQPEEILVGIMWSGPDRHDLYFRKLNYELENTDLWIKNPTHVVENDPGGWLIMNHHWTEKTNKIYYSQLHDFDHQRILTFEKILWVQNYLENLGIKYFMTRYMRDNYLDHPEYKSNPNIEWLEEQVNYSSWLPIQTMNDWTLSHWTIDDYPMLNITLPHGQVVTTRDWHPSYDMHKKFVKDVILPFIKEKFSDYHCPEFKEFIHESMHE